MDITALRAGRWPLALTLATLALGACNDEPFAPKPAASVAAPQPPINNYEWIDVTVTSAGGGTEPGTLRWAVRQAYDSSKYGVNVFIDPRLAGDTITLAERLDLPTAAYIEGPEGGITISGNDQHRVLEAGYELTLAHVTIARGYSADGWGSAINAGKLSLLRTTIQDNRGAGPAVSVNGNLTMINTTISRNQVGMPALRYRGGSSTYIYIEHSTIAYNAPAPGIGVLSGTNTTGTTVVLKNSLLAHNGSPARNCETYYGFSYLGTVISSDWECGEVGIVVKDPLLQPLADNGGPNATHAILPNSPAYNAGTSCGEETDQRGMLRDAKCDVGAFEFTDSTRVTITIDPTLRVDASAPSRALVSGTITCSRDEAFKLALELHQMQKVGKTTVDMHAAAQPSVACGPTPRAFSQKLILSEGAWQNGTARATAQTFEAPEWVAFAQAARDVKLAIVRR